MIYCWESWCENLYFHISFHAHIASVGSHDTDED